MDVEGRIVSLLRNRSYRAGLRVCRFVVCSSWSHVAKGSRPPVELRRFSPDSPVYFYTKLGIIGLGPIAKIYLLDPV